MQMMWPIALAVCADIMYQISAKSTPQDLNPFASLTITYLIGAVISAFMLIRYRDLSRTVHFAVPIGISVALCLLLEQLSVQSPFLF